MSLKIKFLHILLLVICYNYSFAQSNSNQWENAISNWENEIKSEENRLARLENDLRDAQSRRDKLIRQGYTYEDENLLGDNALVSVDKEIYVIKGSIESCKARIESLKKQISEGREKKRTLEIELERQIREAQLREKKKDELAKQKKYADQKAKKDAERAHYEAEKANKQAKYEAEMREWEEKQRLAREEDERRRKALGDEAAAKAAVIGQIKNQNRMNNLMDRHEEHKYNIEQTNPYDMNHEQRQRLGGDYSRARMFSYNTEDTSDEERKPISKLLDKAKSLSEDGFVETQIKAIDIKELRKDIIINPNDDKIGVAEDCEIDQEQINNWEIASQHKSVINQSTFIDEKKRRKRKVPELLVSHERIDLNMVYPFIIPQYGLVVSEGDSLIILTDSLLKKVGWNEFGCSYAVVCGEKIIGRKERVLSELEENGTEKILDVDSDDFSIFPKDDNSIYLLCWKEEISSIFSIDVKSNTYREIVRIPQEINSIVSNSKNTFILTIYDIYTIDANYIPHKFFNSKEIINDIVMTKEGLIIATEEQMILIKDLKKQEIFIDVGAKHMWMDKNKLYFQSMSDDLYMVSF